MSVEISLNNEATVKNRRSRHVTEDTIRKMLAMRSRGLRGVTISKRRPYVNYLRYVVAVGRDLQSRIFGFRGSQFGLA